ncbi:hypothetical protein PN498_17440 [Oscillatoria sp. CS-180]|uniref:hypothetical protein n=1 Tax=Oscillatoria sp. CS-180 TaxID=3021720 RepID=UPI0023300CEC|nr:hypothetical protein [Oscillatoria sp. CS-180]MDB9527783.1 hypothetical protein [Oscillatoria sp. CS-180]
MKLEVSLLPIELPDLVEGTLTPSAFLPETNLSVRQNTSMILAQQFDQDVLGDLGNAVNTFVQSGQVWALLIGFVLGYLLRGVTTYK